ncbi:MAG: hypothetical protein M3Z36_09280 [Acidobacteriota bacterium]|nr:hypothetical protein [Acidobacteriota bacterium]
MSLDRRQFVLASLALANCGKPKAGRIAAYVFVANEDDGSLAVIDLRRFRVSRKIPLDAAPTHVVGWPGARRVFALTPRNGSIVEIDTDWLSVKRKLRVGGNLLGMRLSEDAKSLWVLRRDPHSLIEVRLDDLRIAAQIKLPSPPHDFDLTAASAAISLPAMQAAAIVNLANGKVDRIVQLGAEPRLIRFRRDGKQILTGNTAAGTITAIDGRKGTVLVNLPVSVKPERFCFNNDGGQMFVTGAGSDAVVIVSPYQTQVSETILAGPSPGSMAISTRPEYLFVANRQSGDMTVIDIATREVLAQIPVGQEPCEILITGDNQYALVLNQKSGDVAVIRISTIGKRRTRTAPLFTLIPVGSKPVSGTIYAL